MVLEAKYNINNKYEIGVDEAGKGPMFGRDKCGSCFT